MDKTSPNGNMWIDNGTLYVILPITAQDWERIGRTLFPGDVYYSLIEVDVYNHLKDTHNIIGTTERHEVVVDGVTYIMIERTWQAEEEEALNQVLNSRSLERAITVGGTKGFDKLEEAGKTVIMVLGLVLAIQVVGVFK